MLHYGTQILGFLKNLKLNFAISLKKKILLPTLLLTNLLKKKFLF